MGDRSQERNARATMAKQAYLRQHISASDYQDFGEFCEEVVGNTAIEAWSLEFVCGLVGEFKRKIAERKQLELKQPQEAKSFYMYQTSKAQDLKEIAEQVHQEESKKQHIPKNNKPPTNKQKEETALDVLDSIFKNQKQNEFTSNKYDKSQFDSHNFWEVATIEAPKQKQNEKQRPSFAKQSQNCDTTQFASNKIPIEPQKFQKIFQTGLKLPQTKNQSKESSPKTKKMHNTSFDQFVLEESSNAHQASNAANKDIKVVSIIPKRNEIKLLSVKNINNSKIPYEGELFFSQPLKEFVSCFKSFERHALSFKDIKVTITDHQIINRSFFSSDYVMYHLKVTPANIICKRNMEDFQKLRKNLECFYPGIRLPYLQKIGLFGSQTHPENIEKQKKYLTYFLEDLLSHSQLKNFRILQDFLSLKDHKFMKRKFEEYDKMKKITAIEELCLLQGIVKVQISEPTRQYNQHLQTFTSKMKNCWSNQERIFTQINQMHKRIADLYKQLAEAIDVISKEAKEFNRRVTVSQINSLDGAFQNFLRYTNENIKMHERQSDYLRNEFISRIKYERENMNTLDTVADIRNELTKSYLKRRDHQKGNDTLDYLSERLKDYKNGITEESKNITVLKYQCGYINNLMMNEGHHFFNLLASKIEKVVSNVSFSKIESLSKTISLYGELVTT